LKPLCHQVTTEVTSGPPAMMIESVAVDENCQMIAMVPGTHPKVARFFLGSVSGKVVKHAKNAVVVLRPGQKKDELKHVIVGLDGSKQAKYALKKSIELFNLGKRKVEVTLINVVSIAGVLKFVSPVEFIGAVEDNLNMEGEAVLAEGKKIFSDAG